LAASEAAKEAVWIRQFLDGLRVVPSAADPITIYCDNSGAIFHAKEPKSSIKSRHVLRKYHVIRDNVKRKEIDICKVGTDDEIADPLTKPLSRTKHDAHTASMGLRRMPDFL